MHITLFPLYKYNKRRSFPHRTFDDDAISSLDHDLFVHTPLTPIHSYYIIQTDTASDITMIFLSLSIYYESHRNE